MWYRGPRAITDAIDHAKFFSRSHDAVVRIYDQAGNVIETHEQAGDFKEWWNFFFILPGVCSLVTFRRCWKGMETIRDNGHSDRVVKKCQRIAGLKALLKEWELSGDLDLDYIRGLKARLLSVQNQLKNMCGHDGSEGMDDW
jgi:hypothetical protein